MRVETTVEDGVWRDIHATVGRILERYLDPAATAPVIVAFSGGGDSLALLLAAKTWADRAGRDVRAVTVDHRLRREGADWALWCRARCAALGVPHATVVWEGDKPATGLSAAARAARHALIADHARSLRAVVVLMGHTADDRLEAAAMRAAGASVSDPRLWAPSPVWPQGRGLFVLRPLLGVRRADIRAALTACRETWIDDPGNTDPAQTRARARLSLAGDPAPPPPDRATAPSSRLFDHVRQGPLGDLAIDVAVLASVPTDDVRAFVAAALLCAAGTTRPPRGERLDRLVRLIGDTTPFVTTLAGARVQSDGVILRFMRDAGEFARRGWVDAAAPIDRPFVFDGRFEIVARDPGWSVGPLRGRTSRLSKVERSSLKAAPPGARAASPVCVSSTGAVTAAAGIDHPKIAVRCLIMPRLRAALSVTNCESDVSHMAKTHGMS